MYGLENDPQIRFGIVFCFGLCRTILVKIEVLMVFKLSLFFFCLIGYQNVFAPDSASHFVILGPLSQAEEQKIVSSLNVSHISRVRLVKF